MSRLVAHLTLTATRTAMRRAAANRDELVPETTEEERMLARLDPDLADRLKRRMAGEPSPETSFSYDRPLAEAVASTVSPVRSLAAVPAGPGVTWDTSNSVAPPS